MRKFHLNSILIFVIYLFSSIIFVNCFPCPSDCICKPTDLLDEDFKRMSYSIDCRNVLFNNNQLIYQAQSWSIFEDIIGDDPDDMMTNDYIVSIDLSNSLKEFTNQTIQLSNFSFSISSLSLTNQSNDFLLHSNSFDSALYQNLKQLNLSSCCQQIPIECPQLFRSLPKLELLDLSRSDMYKNCLHTPDTISSSLHDLILRHNHYNSSTFSHSSAIFNGVRTLSGKLDLQYSQFHMGTNVDGNCLFDLFTRLTILDLSSIEFQSITNDTEVHLAHFIRCKTSNNQVRQGEQLVELYLRQLNLQNLPEWFTDDRFPLLTHLDLSNNQIHSIDLHTFLTLTTVSLAYNPITIEQIQWRPDHIYQSINLRSTIVNQTWDLTTTMQNLFQLSTNIDYSENRGLISSNLSRFPIEIDFTKEISLNLSQMNLYSFEIQEISKFDDLYRLDVSGNHLFELHLDKQSELTYLDCSNQNLTKLILNKDSSKLIQIKCSNNSLKTIENLLLDKHKDFQSIDLSFNSIELLENFFSPLNNRRLQMVNFKWNSIKKISTNLFHGKLLSLYSIDLSWNQINLIETSSFQSPNLQILDLTGNPLKSIESNFLITSSLRLFYIINDTQQLISRCAQSNSNDNLLLTYIAWLEQNGTYMIKTQQEKSEQIQLDKCLRRYTSRSKVKWTKFHQTSSNKYLSLYITLITIAVGMLLTGIYWYKKNQRKFFGSIQRYRPLDRNHLLEHTDEFSHQPREDDEIVMNLEEPPFNAINRS